MIVLLSIIFPIFLLTNSKNVKASNEPVITVESKEIHRGQTFDLNVNLETNPVGILSLQLYIQYDRTAMTLVNAKQGEEALRSLTMTVRNPDEGLGYAARDFNILWSGDRPDYKTGTIVTLTFESNIDADEGEYEVSFTYIEKNTSTSISENIQYIDVTINPGTITFRKGAYIIYYVDYDWDGTENDVLYKYEYSDETKEEDKSLREFPIGNPTIKEPSREPDIMYSYAWDRDNPWTGLAYVDSYSSNIIVYQANYIKTPQEKTIIYHIAEVIDDETTFKDYTYWNERGVEIDAGMVIGYGEALDLPYPSLEDYTFYGWYKDENFSVKFVNTTMIAVENRLDLYGYFKYNIRENDIPTISVTYEGKTDDDLIIVDLELLDNINSGISNMVLELYWQDGIKLVDYDDLTLTNFEGLHFVTTTGGEYIQGYRFLYESGNRYQNNSYEEGKFLRLYFDRQAIDTPQGSYWIKVINSEAEFIDESSKQWYTHINFKPDNGETLNTDGKAEEHYFTVPIGTRNKWVTKEDTYDKVIVSSDKDVDININLQAISTEINSAVDRMIKEEIDNDKVAISSSYDITLLQNQKELNIKEIGTILEISLKLTDHEKSSEYLGFFYVDMDEGIVKEFIKDSNKMEPGYWHLSEDGEYLVFYTDHLSEWNIVSDKIIATTTNIGIIKLLILIFPSLGLAIIVFGTILKNKKIIKKKTKGAQ